MSIPQAKQMRRAYGFDEVAIVPGDVTVNPALTETSFRLGELEFPLPILAAAMDAVVDPRFAASFAKVGGLPVLNLEGVQTRYEQPDAVLEEIAAAPPDKATVLLQRAYAEPIQTKLIGERIREIQQSGTICAVSCTPVNTKQFAPLAKEAGVDIFVIQSTVTSARHVSTSAKGLVFPGLVEYIQHLCFLEMPHDRCDRLFLLGQEMHIHRLDDSFA